MMTKLQALNTNNCKNYQEIKQRNILFDEKHAKCTIAKKKIEV